MEGEKQEHKHKQTHMHGGVNESRVALQVVRISRTIKRALSQLFHFVFKFNNFNGWFVSSGYSS